MASPRPARQTKAQTKADTEGIIIIIDGLGPWLPLVICVISLKHMVYSLGIYALTVGVICLNDTRRMTCNRPGHILEQSAGTYKGGLASIS